MRAEYKLKRKVEDRRACCQLESWCESETEQKIKESRVIQTKGSWVRGAGV